MQSYQEHIEPDAPQATTPEELHPIAAAFGGDIGAALEKTGDQIAGRIEQLTKHMATMNYYRGQQAVADKALQMKNDQNPVLFGDPNNPNATVTKTRTPVDALSPQDVTLSAGGSAPSSTAPYAATEPQTYEVPAGILQRKGNQAAGALQDYHDWYTNYSQQMIQQARNEGLGERNIRSMKIRMDADFASNGRFIAAHEAKELDSAQQQTFLKGMQLDADNAVIKQDPISLGRTIDSINENNRILNDSQGKAADDPVRELTANKFIGQALNNSMISNLRTNGGDPTQFQSMLDRLHDDKKINDTVYDNAQMRLDKTSEAIIKQNNRAAKVNDVNTTLDYISKVIDGKIDFNNPNVINEIRSNSPTTGAAIDNYTLNKSATVKPDDEAIAHSVDELYKTGSREEIAKFNVKIMKEFPNGVPQGVINTMMADGIERAKHLSDLENEKAHPNPFIALRDSAMKALLSWNKQQPQQDGQSYVDYMNSVKQGKDPQEAYKSATTNSIIRGNPSVATMATPPNFVITKDSHIKSVFPMTNRKEDGSNGTTK